mgnify:FL=1
MRILLIADLHLSEQHPRLTRGFLDLLHAHQDEPTALYILGDWFNVWLDDRDTSPWLEPIITAMQAFTQAGNQVYFLAGNRDFVLGQGFLNRFAGQLLQEPHFMTWQGLHLRLEHGDSLCTDDVSYQRFKKIIRNPLVLGILKSLPFALKQKLGSFFRSKSREHQSQNHYQPIDVNMAEVQRQMQGVDVLVHGHTHRPEIQNLPLNKTRIVLGDWREDEGCAKILYLENPEHWQLSLWRF